MRRDALRIVRWVPFAVLAALMATPAAAFAQLEAPGFVYAKAVRGHHTLVNWEPPLSDVDVSYRVYRAEGSALPEFHSDPELRSGWTLVGTRSGRTTNSLYDSAPKANSTRYWYVVTTVSGSIESSASPVNSQARGWNDPAILQYMRYLPPSEDSYEWYIGPTTLPPLEPTNVTVSGVDTTITVSWDAVAATNITGYYVYRSTQSGVLGAEIGFVAAPATEFIDADTPEKRVRTHTNYWYRVVAQDSTGATGTPSVERHIRTESSAVYGSPHDGNKERPGAETCSVCHQLHAAPGPSLLKTNQDTEIALCLTCHDGTGSSHDVRREYTKAHASSHAVTVTDDDGVVEVQGTFSCVQCHSPHAGATPSPKMLLVDGVAAGNGVCYGSGCHGGTEPANGIDLSEAFEASVHNTELPEPESGTGVKCSTCHRSHAATENSLSTSRSDQVCLTCHSSGDDDLANLDVYARLTLGGSSGTSRDVHSPDQNANGTAVACQNCHNSHSVTRDNLLVNPWSPGVAPEEQWNEARTAPLAVSDGDAAEPRYNAFCLSCHGEQGLPDESDTAPWANPPRAARTTADIGDDWMHRVHGRSSRGSGGPTLDPGMGYQKGQTLSCMVCHEPHATTNGYNLRSSVPASDGVYPNRDLLVVQGLDPSGKPVEGQTDTRFFCGSCHASVSYPVGHADENIDSADSYLWFPNNCTDGQCHTHGIGELDSF